MRLTLRKRESDHQRKCIKRVGFTTTKYDDFDYKGTHNGHEIIIQAGAMPNSWIFIVDGVEGLEEYETKLSAIWWALAEINAF